VGALEARWLAARPRACLAALAISVAIAHGCDVVADPIVDGAGAAGGQGGAAGSGTGGADCGPDGTPCDAGICAGGVCCPSQRACGDTCCPDGDPGQICSFRRCVDPGPGCIDDDDCPGEQICDHTPSEEPDGSGAGGNGGSGGGASCPTAPTRLGQCVPPPPPCNPTMPPTAEAPLACLTSCVHRPESIAEATLRWSWGDRDADGDADSVIATPLVIPLDDDDCSGAVDQGDVPEIVVVTFENGNTTGGGRLRALSTQYGALDELWSTQPSESEIAPHRTPAAGDIDGNPGNEIVLCTVDDRVRAYRAGGGELWTSEAGTGCVMLSLADLDADGDVEVIAGAQVLDGVTGNVVATLDPASALPVVAGDVDGDGDLDLVTPGRAYHGDGSLMVDTGLAGSHAALGDLDGDGLPEVIVADKAAHQLRVWRWVPANPGFVVVRAGIDLHATLPPSDCPGGSVGQTQGGGPPVVADFDGDGTPDVGLAAGLGYVVLDGAKLMFAPGLVADSMVVPDDETVRWVRPNDDCTSAETGSSAFDFDGDGKSEVVYADELTLGIYDGASGEALLGTCLTNRTLTEYPVIADVDGDGVADLVAVANSHTALTCDGRGSSAGVRVFGSLDDGWVRAPGIWNQHAHHLTNVLPDGTIPEGPPQAISSFRRARVGDHRAPDLIASVTARCLPTYALVARVLNIGQARAPAGVPIGFYGGEPADGGFALGIATTSRPLHAGEAEDVLLEIESPPADLEDGATPAYVVVDDQAPPHAWRECRADNNTSPAVHLDCSGPPQ
jgi:hypothetical protein